MVIRTLFRSIALAGAFALVACLPPRAPAEIEYRSGGRAGAGPPHSVATAPPQEEPAETRVAVIPVSPAPMTAARPDDTAVPPSAPGVETLSGDTIVVQEGEGLYLLAERHMTSLRALIELNDLQPPFRLSQGQTLRLPAPNTHVIAPGETLYGVSRRYRIQLRSLAYLNDIEPPYAVSPGQALVLPALARDWEATAAPVLANGPVDISPPQNPSAPEPDEAQESAAPPSRFAWPLDGPVVEGFGVQERGRRHDGVNIAASAGDAVRATADGSVVYAGDELAGYGRLLLIQHDGGWVSAYAHNQTLRVSEGAVVRQGDVIAEAGATGAVDDPQLHFELRHQGRPVDPFRHLPQRAG